MRISQKALPAALLLIFTSASWGADFDLGQEAYNMGDYETALAEWQPLADEGQADSQFGVALLYANGFGVALDDAVALKWYLLAADQGHAGAQCNLAVMHANGWGVAQSDAEAYRWYNLAAEQGSTEAQINLSQMYRSGFGIAEDKVQARKWLSIANDLGDLNADYKREELARSMSAEEIAEADGLSAAWVANNQHLVPPAE